MPVCGRSTEEILAEHAQFKMALEATNKRMAEGMEKLRGLNNMFNAARAVALDLAYKTNAPFNVDEAIKKRFDSLQSESPK